MLRVLRSGMAAVVNAEAAAMHTASESAFVAILQSVSSQELGRPALMRLTAGKRTVPRSQN